MRSQKKVVLEYTLVTINQIWGKHRCFWAQIYNTLALGIHFFVPQKKWSFQRGSEGNAIFCCDVYKQCGQLVFPAIRIYQQSTSGSDSKAKS